MMAKGPINTALLCCGVSALAGAYSASGWVTVVELILGSLLLTAYQSRMEPK